MSVTYTWKIEKIECRPVVGAYENVVSSVHWRLFAAAGAVQESTYGSATIDLVEEAAFTPFDQITEAMVLDWVQAKVGAERIASLEAALAQMIADRITPPVVSPPLPWVAA